MQAALTTKVLSSANVVLDIPEMDSFVLVSVIMYLPNFLHISGVEI
jgi:hypothetical protein